MKIFILKYPILSAFIALGIIVLAVYFFREWRKNAIGSRSDMPVPCPEGMCGNYPHCLDCPERGAAPIFVTVRGTATPTGGVSPAGSVSPAGTTNGSMAGVK